MFESISINTCNITGMTIQCQGEACIQVGFYYILI